MGRKFLPLGFALLIAGFSHANENPFGCSGDACVSKHGEREFQQSVSIRRGLDLGTGYDGGYRGYDLATQLEIGLTDDSHVDLILSGCVLRSADFRGSFLEGFSVEYKRLISAPKSAGWNAAWAGAFRYSRVDSANGVSRIQTGGFGRLFLQRHFGANGNGCYVTNLSGGLSHDPDGTSAMLQWSHGLAYRVNECWSYGIEGVAEGCWTHGRVFKNSSLCAGPCIAYRFGEGSVVLNHLWQLSGAPATSGHRNLRDKSQSETRLLVAWGF